MQKLTALKVAKGVLKHWDRLGCNNNKDSCLYDYGDGTGCAIGVNLTKKTLELIKGTPQVHRMCVLGLNGKLFDFPKEDAMKLLDIQNAHDDAINKTSTPEMLRTFCEEVIKEANDAKAHG